MISLTVQNLVENAVKYNRRGGKILVSAEKHDHVVQIFVGNSGPGIKPERAPHVFERFYRARGDEQTPGHGLGLSIARELARAHGGDLTLTRVHRIGPNSVCAWAPRASTFKRNNRPR